jgi:hypothetical protein
MRLGKLIMFASMILALDTVHRAVASQDTIGPNGIRSASLGLTGAGVVIGPVNLFVSRQQGNVICC